MTTTTQLSTSTPTSALAKKARRGPCGRHGPFGRRGGPFFAPDFFSSSFSSSSSSSPPDEEDSLVTMVVVGGGTPESADAASFPLALPRERQLPPSSLPSPSLSGNGPLEMFTSLVRALEAAASGGSGGGVVGSRQTFLLSGDNEPLAEKKILSDDDDDDDDGEKDEDEDVESGAEQQQHHQEEEDEEEDEAESDGLPEAEAPWLSSLAAESAAAGGDGELGASPLSATPASFDGRRPLGSSLGFALLCAASGAAWVATVSAAKRAGEKASSEGQRDDDKEIPPSSSSPLLEALAGAGKEGFESTLESSVENTLYYGVVKAADFAEK